MLGVLLIGLILLIWLPRPLHAGETLPPRTKPTIVKSDQGHHKDRPLGAHIQLQLPNGQPGDWTVVQWQDSAGNWHDVEGWRGVSEGNQQKWWVDAKDFRKGPFRWVVYAEPEGQILSQSKPFYLPAGAAETVMVELATKAQ
jgi:hypothetical protein